MSDSDFDSELDEKWGELSPWHDPYVLANFKARPTDVLITTPAKAGTTWMQQILHQLRSGGDDNFESIDTEVPWIEIPRQGKSWQMVLAEFEDLKEPRCFKTHCTFPQTPGVGTARFILTSRDPRDCCVSFYHHKKDMTNDAREQFGIDEPESFDSFFEEWIEYAGWYRNVESWWPHYNDKNVLWLRYEDLKQDLDKGLNQILDFLGWSITKDQRKNVLTFCSFDWMKANTYRFTIQGKNEKPQFKPGGFIRKGQVGGGKTMLSAEQEKRVIDMVYERLEADCVKFLGL
jgi:hypothetical protein